MPTLEELITEITDISKNKYIQTASDITLTSRINASVNDIAAGIRLPDGRTSPPLPDLFETDTIATTVHAYADLPSTYQRNLFYVSDSAVTK